MVILLYWLMQHNCPNKELHRIFRQSHKKGSEKNKNILFLCASHFQSRVSFLLLPDFIYRRPRSKDNVNIELLYRYYQTRAFWKVRSMNAAGSLFLFLSFFFARYLHGPKFRRPRNIIHSQ